MENYMISPVMNTIFIDKYTAMKEEDELEDLIHTAMCEIKDKREIMKLGQMMLR